jgi:drug/metabolite transporter (DMT)-like permease
MRTNLPRRRLVVGGLLTLGVVIIWACEVKVLQWVHSNNACLDPPSPPAAPPPPAPPAAPPSGCQHLEWDKPFCVGIALKAIWILGLPLVLLRRRLIDAHPAGSLPLSRRTIIACGGLTLLVQGASVTWVWSVPLTSASLNSAIYQSSCALAYVFSLPLLKEEYLSASKSLGVLLALGGVLLVVLSKKREGSPDAVPHAGLGEILVFASAAIYALKEVLYKRWMSPTPPSSSADGSVQQAAAAAASSPPPPSPTPVADAALCVSLIGTWCVLSAPIWLLLLHLSGIEPFEMPPWHLARGYLIVAFMMMVYQVQLFAAIAITSPTFVAVGQLLVAPISMLIDLIDPKTHYTLPPPALIGTCGIIGALALVIYARAGDAAMREALERVREWCGWSRRRKRLVEETAEPAAVAHSLPEERT